MVNVEVCSEAFGLLFGKAQGVGRGKESVGNQAVQHGPRSRAHLAEFYGVSVSEDYISWVTDQFMDGIRAWQNRPLDPCYPIGPCSVTNVFDDVPIARATRPDTGPVTSLTTEATAELPANASEAAAGTRSRDARQACSYRRNPPPVGAASSIPASRRRWPRPRSWLEMNPNPKP